MTATPRPARLTTLGQNQYGKAECRLLRVVRDADAHRIKDLDVSVALSGDMDEVHYNGSNAHVLPTDTTKNTVFAFAKEYGVASAEEFAVRLARHFVTGQPQIHRARIRVKEHGWQRIGDTGHSFARTGQETRTAEVVFDGERLQVVSGLQDLVVLNTTDSEFWGYAKDRYTTLKEAYDRILATEVAARWRFAWTGDGDAPDFEQSYAAVRADLLAAFAGTYSLSLQQTLYAMGSRVVGSHADIDEIRLSLPNKHHFLVDLEPFGLANDDEVYLAADRPYGLIEGTVLRDGVEARIPTD